MNGFEVNRNGYEASLLGIEVIVFNFLDADEADDTDNADFKFADYQLAAQPDASAITASKK